MRPRAVSANRKTPASLRSPTTLAPLDQTWSMVRRLLAVRLDNLGDVIMLSPALRTLRQYLPEAELHLMASPTGCQIAPLLPWISDVFIHRAIWQDLSGGLMFDVSSQHVLIDQLRRRQYDAAVIFTSFSQSPYPPAYAFLLAGIPLRLGQSREFGGTLLSRWVTPLADPTHQVDRNLHLLEAVGLAPAGRDLELKVSEEVKDQVDNLLATVKLRAAEPFIAFAPGASCAARRYDPLRFAESARGLVQATGLPVVIVGSAKEADLLGPFQGMAHPRIVSLVGRTTVVMLAEVVRRAHLVVANNSAAMHLADAFGRPVVVLYSGTDQEEQWRPRRAPARLLRRPTACAPCRAFTCPHQMECLDIPPAAVVEAAMELLSQSTGNVLESLAGDAR